MNKHNQSGLRKSLLVVIILALLTFAVPTPAAHAASITVDTFDDELNSDGDCSLREAITAANTNVPVDACISGEPGPDTINFSVTGMIALTHREPMPLNIIEDLTFAGPGTTNLTITESSPSLGDRLMQVAAGVTLNFQDLTIADSRGILNLGAIIVTNSTFSGNIAPFGIGFGGAIAGGTVIVENSTFSGNHLDTVICTPNVLCGGGGAIFADTVTVMNSTFSGNGGGAGGAIFANVVSVTNSTFSSNDGGHGGAIYIDEGSDANYVIDSIFTDNRADKGGAIFFSPNHDLHELASLNVSDSIFSDNRVGNAGGAIFNNFFGSLTVTNSTFSDNHADGNGGAIFNKDFGSLSVTDSTFSDNSAAFNGGAIGSDFDSSTGVINSIFSGNSATFGGVLTVREGGGLGVKNSTFSGNSAASGGVIGIDVSGDASIFGSTFSGNRANGGGVIANENGGRVGVINSTFSGNSAASGGGILNSSGDVGIFNSTFSGNSAESGSGLFNDAYGTIGLSNTIIANGVNSEDCYVDPASVIIDGGNNLQTGGDPSCGESIPIANPMLGPLQDNGGPTLTHALLPGSPAIDAVPLADCTDTTDQRGIVRPQGERCDIGAFEFETESENLPPTVSAYGPYVADEGSSAIVTASGTDPEGGSLTYAWDFDSDGTFETSGQSAIFFAAGLDGPSSHTIAVQVTDEGGLTATDQAIVNVLNVAPTADLTIVPTTLIQGDSAALTFSNPFDPGVADTAVGFRYSYDCTNDGLFELADSSLTRYDCVYPIAGVFTVRGRIADKDGGFTDHTVSVVALTPQQATENLTTSIEDLVAGKILTSGQGNALISKLEAAIKQLERGNIATAINQLQAFINQVSALINSGILSPADGQLLIDTARAIIAALGN